jgi:hypothetical protein
VPVSKSDPAFYVGRKSFQDERRQPEIVGGITMSKSTFAGFLLTAFAFGIVATVVIYRTLPPRTYEEPAATRLEPLPSPPPPPAPRTFAPEIRELPVGRKR